MNRYLGITFGTILSLLATLGAWGQTATLMPNAVQQYFDSNGKVLSTGTVGWYVPTTMTPKTIWSDSGETTPITNPVVLGISGRPPNAIYGDGLYRQIVKDHNGAVIWDALTSSTGGSGGGSAPAFSEGVMVGTIIAWANTTLPSKYLYAAGSPVSRNTYSALFTAITFSNPILCQIGIATITVPTAISDAMPIGGPVEATCFAPGTTVLSKSSGSLTLSTAATTTVSVTATFLPWGNGDGSTTFNLPDLRGNVIAGRNNMPGPGIVPRITTTYFGVNPNALGAQGGNESATLSTANLPPYTPAGTIVVSSAQQAGTSAVAFPSGAGTNVPAPSAALAATAAFTGTAQGGTAVPIPRVQPTLTADYIIKALPDDSPTGPGVTSVQGMTGALGCGSGITCTAQTISAPPSVSSIQGMTGNITCGTGINCTGQVINISSSTILSPTGGNDTPQIQAAANANANTIQLSCGSYTLNSSVTVPAGGLSLVGQNSNCVTVNVSGAFYGITCSSRTARVNIGNINFVGTAANFNGTLNISDLGQGAISISDCPFVDVGGLYVQNMSGSAIACQAPSSAFTSAAAPKFHNLAVFNSYHALHPSNSCEYAAFTNIIARNNIYGALIEAGNVLLDGFVFAYNYNNIQVIGRANANPCHGTVSNGEANHGVAFNLAVISCSVGMTFSNVSMIADGGGSLSAGGGLLNIYNSTGVNISGGQMGSNVNVIAADPVGGSTALSGPNRMSDIFARTAIAGFTNPAIGYTGGLAIIDALAPGGPWSQMTSGTIASGALALATSAIGSATCSSAQTATATGATTSDAIQATFSGDPTAVTGYIPSTAGMLTIIGYPTANTVNFKVCNNTVGSITPGAVTVNWRVVR